MNLLRDISPFLRKLSQLGDKSKQYIRVSKRGVSNFMLFHGYTGDKNPRHLPYGDAGDHCQSRIRDGSGERRLLTTGGLFRLEGGSQGQVFRYVDRTGGSRVPVTPFFEDITTLGRGGDGSRGARHLPSPLHKMEQDRKNRLKVGVSGL